MVQKITEGISVSVETFYQPAQSNPINAEYLFVYRITIENLTEFPVKLLRRHWHILDSNGSHREVEGEGVVGQQPLIEPNETYQYISAANLKSDIGKMFGTYEMINMYNRKKIIVSIPEFQMIAPFKLN
ncbi:MAG: Co2+/Mg2+ efflux protein ApaG [Crocinitomicaceae bacterium]|nr:Co2+/Mg2+ efflux protein ApaG [Crocinitomicaceae bacterium]